jgi:hypothetical protein
MEGAAIWDFGLGIGDCNAATKPRTVMARKLRGV